MGAFEIFAAILTFAYVVYYAVMIGMDLFGSNAQKKENVEVIAANNNDTEGSTVEDEAPTFIAEEGASGDADDNQNNGVDKEPLGDSNLSPEDIESADDNELCKQAKEVKEQMQKAEIRSNADYTEAGMEQNLQQLMREQEAKAGELS